MNEFSGVVKGSLVSKANSRRITRQGRVIKSAKALAYTESAIWQLKSMFKGKTFTEPVGLELTIFYDSRRPDLSPELFFDCLQKAGVLENDRLITEYFCRKELSKTEPRVEFCVYKLS